MWVGNPAYFSRSDLLREIIDSMTTEPTERKLELNFNENIVGLHQMEINDKLGNPFILSIDYRPNFNLWRIVVQKIGSFNILNFVASVDLVKETRDKDNEVWLNFINPYESDEFKEAEEFVWSAVKQLAKEKGWSKIYGELTLSQIEENPRRLSWLKQKYFNLESQSHQQNLHFSLLLNDG